MSKQWLSGPQRCLLQKWTDARAVENTMEEVREEYKAILSTVLDRVQEKYGELDRLDIHAKNDNLNLGIGKTMWSSARHWTSGLWIGGIRIENLTSEEGFAPYAMVLINRPKKAINLEMAERKLSAAAERILPKEEFRRLDSSASSTQAYISYYLREPRHKLLGLLLKGDGSGYVDYMAAQFESMAKFIPVFDRIFQAAKKKKRN